MNNKSTNSLEFPQLPIMSLSTADEMSTLDLCAGRMTILDLWTTKCVRCPAALDKLNEMAIEHPDIQFVSICCDSLDGARNIIEQNDELKWSSVQHYFMDQEHKEKAKAILGFKQVPFYVVLDERGIIMEKGNTIDFSQYLVDKENQQNKNDIVEDNVFFIDDLDF